MLLHMHAATSATASAPREPVKRRCRKRAYRPQQHAARKVPAQMIHLANQGDRGTKDDRAHAGAEVGEHGLARTGEPGTEAMGADDAGKQNCQTQQACEFYPMGSNESQKRSCGLQIVDAWFSPQRC